jgi:hypothetical protein
MLWYLTRVVLVNDHFILCNVVCIVPITVAAWSEAWTVFACLNVGIVGSNPTQDMGVYVPFLFVCVVLCGSSGLEAVWYPVQGVLPTLLIKKFWKRPRSNKRTIDQEIDSVVVAIENGTNCENPSIYIPNIRLNDWTVILVTGRIIMPINFRNVGWHR